MCTQRLFHFPLSFFLFFFLFSSGVAANIAAGALGTRIEINKTRSVGRGAIDHAVFGTVAIRHAAYLFSYLGHARARARAHGAPSIESTDSSRLLPDFYVIFASSRNDSISIRYERRCFLGTSGSEAINEKSFSLPVKAADYAHVSS